MKQFFPFNRVIIRYFVYSSQLIKDIPFINTSRNCTFFNRKKGATSTHGNHPPILAALKKELQQKMIKANGSPNLKVQADDSKEELLEYNKLPEDSVGNVRQEAFIKG